MTLPRAVRVNVGAPFPALVKGDAGIAIGRQNGIWTVGLGYMTVGLQNAPPTANYNTDYVLIYDSLQQTYIRVPLTAVASGSRTQRSVTTAPVAVLATDQILNLNLNAAGNIPLPAATQRNGVPLTFKDIGMQASTNPQTLQCAAGDQIDGLMTSLALNLNGQAITLTPANDGVNSGWLRL